MIDDPDATPAARLKAVARDLARLSPDRRDPEQFHVVKSELVGELRRRAGELEIRRIDLRSIHVQNIEEVRAWCAAPLL